MRERSGGTRMPGTARAAENMLRIVRGTVCDARQHGGEIGTARKAAANVAEPLGPRGTGRDRSEKECGVERAVTAGALDVARLVAIDRRRNAEWSVTAEPLSGFEDMSRSIGEGMRSGAGGFPRFQPDLHARGRDRSEKECGVEQHLVARAVLGGEQSRSISKGMRSGVARVAPPDPPRAGSQSIRKGVWSEAGC